jgi:hypothetical protein
LRRGAVCLQDEKHGLRLDQGSCFHVSDLRQLTQAPMMPLVLCTMVQTIGQYGDGLYPNIPSSLAKSSNRSYVNRGTEVSRKNFFSKLHGRGTPVRATRMRELHVHRQNCAEHPAIISLQTVNPPLGLKLLHCACFTVFIAKVLWLTISNRLLQKGEATIRSHDHPHTWRTCAHPRSGCRASHRQTWSAAC